MPRGTPLQIDDRLLVRTVRAIRAERGACTYRELAARLGCSPKSVHRRCKALLEAGVLTASDEAGSLRAAPRRR